MNTRVPWKRSRRVERVGAFSLQVPPEKVFPLLCPVAEYDWLPGWSCTMVHSATGVAEKDAIFLTEKVYHRKSIWTAITYEAPRLIEYLVVAGTDLVVRVNVSLGSVHGGCEVEWRSLMTASSPAAERFLESRSEAAYAAMLEERKRQLEAYLTR